jgi:hypothetical protein
MWRTGGYINGEGVVSSPNYLTDDDDIDECYWFVEARQSDGVVCLKRDGMTDLVSNSQLPIMTVCHYIVQFKISGYFINCVSVRLSFKKVYDGWNTSGNVLYIPTAIK